MSWRVGLWVVVFVFVFGRSACSLIGSLPKPTPSVTDPSLAISDEIRPGGTLGPGEALDAPAEVLIFGSDGNLELRARTGVSLWSSRTSSAAPAAARMQGDGNFVLRDRSGRVFWSTGTSGHPGARLKLRGDGRVRIVSREGTVLWDSKDHPNG